MVGDRESYIAAGMNSYTSKPVNGLELFAMIDALVPDEAPAAIVPGSGAVDVDQSAAHACTDGDGDVESVLDATVIESLRELDRESTSGILSKVIGVFLETTPVDMALLLDAIDAGKVESAAHKLKTGCANVGAITLARGLNDIEILARNGDIAATAGRRDILAGEFPRVCTALEKIR
jgi:HPt (histidine-containing phosphotransfer) domain-containing protein